MLSVGSSKNQLRAVDFFSGAGGLTYGLRTAGINVIAGIDIDGECKETYEKNNKGAVFLERDITIYKPKKLEKELEIERGDDDMIFVGCAPCQYWSHIQTDRGKSKKERNLILEFAEFVKYFKPGFVVAENVHGIARKKGSPVNKFVSSLESMGYEVDHEVVDMSLYGVPQKRKRFILVASRVSDISLPEPTGRMRTVRDVIGDRNKFPRIKHGTYDRTKFMHTAAKLTDANLSRLKLTRKNGGDRSEWQKKRKHQLDCYISAPKTFVDTYARMWWDEPSPTITTRFNSVSNGRFAHPRQNRGISLREGASLQTFPRNYRFIAQSIATVTRMIGNAVPPKFARMIGRQLVKSGREREGR